MFRAFRPRFKSSIPSNETNKTNYLALYVASTGSACGMYDCMTIKWDDEASPRYNVAKIFSRFLNGFVTGPILLPIDIGYVYYHDVKTFINDW
jgi:hypothetical protein